MLLIIVNY